MNRLVSVDKAARRARVQPGLVLDQLNKALRAEKLFFPVDVSTGNRATLGGMAANNSCGARSLRYGNMVHNVRAIDAILADGTAVAMGEVPGNFDESATPERYSELVRQMRALHNRESLEIERRFPKLLRRVGGYNIDMIADQGHNMAHLLPRARSPSSARSSSICSRSRHIESWASATSRPSTRRWRPPRRSWRSSPPRSSWSTAP